ncbi:phage fiber-tail adaptor protein [Streptomyces sp. NPDC055085]
MAEDAIKGPTEVLDYEMDWGQLYLAVGESISASTFAPDAGITKDSESNTTTKAKVWLSGGTQGIAYTVRNTITTSGGRTAVRSFTVRVTSR